MVENLKITKTSLLDNFLYSKVVEGRFYIEYILYKLEKKLEAGWKLVGPIQP
jgi:hypothetical protein